MNDYRCMSRTVSMRGTNPRSMFTCAPRHAVAAYIGRFCPELDPHVTSLVNHPSDPHIIYAQMADDYPDADRVTFWVEQIGRDA